MAFHSQLECQVCCKTFSGPVPAQQHFMSHEHKKKEENLKQGKPGPACDVCLITCDTLKILEQHNQSPRHQANAAKRQREQFGNKFPTDAQNYTEMSSSQSEAYKFSSINNRGFCFICQIHLTSSSHAQSHIIGKAHKKKLAQFQGMNASHLYTNQPENYMHQNAKSVNYDDFQRSAMHAVSSQTRPDLEQIPNQNTQTSKTIVNNSMMCDVCCVTFTGQASALQHFSSEKHKKKANQVNTGLGNKPNYSCSLCNVVFTGPENEKIHNVSQKHVKNVKLKEKRERGEELPLFCNACGCTFTGQENAEAHFDSRKHIRTMENVSIKSGISNRVTLSEPTDSPVSAVSAFRNGDEGIVIKPLASRLVTERTRGQSDNTFTRSVSNSHFRNICDINQINGQEIRGDNDHEFVTTPKKQMENSCGNQSQEDTLFVKPVDTAERSLIIKPCGDEISPFTQNRQNDGESLDIDTTTLTCLTDEQKIKAETHTSICQLVDSFSLKREDFSSGDTGSVRYFRNDLETSIAPMGRGRGIFSMFVQKEEKLPGKVLNTDTCYRNTVVGKKGFDINETMKKSVWEGTSAVTETETPMHENQSEKSRRYEATLQLDSFDKFLGDTVSMSQDIVNKKDDMNRLRPTDFQRPYEMEECFLDESTGREKCNICDIEFTSSKHKIQHISGKNHLKAREVRKQMVAATGFSSLVCQICAVTFSGNEAKEQHMASEKHKRKERRLLNGEENDLFCDICKVSCSGPDNLLQHQMGAQHRKMAGISSIDDSATLALNFDRTKWFLCEVCKCSMNTYEQLKIHEKSPRHLKQLEKQLSSGVLNASGDLSQWYPCHVCNCSMNTYEQLQIHEKSPRHLKQLEKLTASGDVLIHDRTHWYPCAVCNCSLNSEEQLRIHEASPAHIAKLQKYRDITHMGTYDTTFTPKSEYGSMYNSDNVTPLQSFLSEELFPEEFLPKTDSPVNKREHSNLVNDFEEKLVIRDEPFNIPEHFAHVGRKHADIDHTEQSGISGGTKRGQGSDLAWATRPRGSRENNGKNASSHSPSKEFNFQDARQNQTGWSPANIMGLGQTSKPEPTVNNPYAATHPYYCHTCKAPMNTKESYERHLTGKRHMQKVCTEPAPQRKHRLPQSLPESYLPFTQTQSRNYQQELHKKAMKNDTLCFLPTGTGKTLVAVMSISAMLEKYPSKNVLFLVDKVLLVIQQSKYIIKEIGDKEYERFNPDSDTCLDIERRTPRIAAVCMDQQATHGVPLWKHDVVIVTAAFCKNLLDKQILRWEDFGLVVFDEAHHCEKGHPFNSLLATYHKRTIPENKPKILGLTASPAGKADVPKTLQMLQGLIANMGDVCMTIVEDHEHVDTLQEYQSNAEMIIRSQIDTSDLLENKLKHEMNVYIMFCVLRLNQISNINFYLDFDSGLNFNMNEKEVRSIADDFVSRSFEMIQLSLNMIESKNIDSASKVEFSVFRMHVQSICMALSCLEEGGALIALQEMEDMEATGNNFEFARGLGMPTGNLQQMVSRKGQGLDGQSSHEKGDTSDFHIKRLIDELTDCGTTSHDSDKKSISLVLVKQRRTAHLIARVLQNSERMRRLGLNTTCVVGHGGSGSTDKGMNVNQQKRVLEDIRQYKYQVIVATSVAEEGVDWPECERVISLYPPSTVTALVQMRGRARRKNSKFIVLCSSQEEEGKLYDIMQREENMITATRILIKQNRDT